LGNHDLDFGDGHFRKLRAQCDFPWLCSNAVYNEHGHPEKVGSGNPLRASTVEETLDQPLGGCETYVVQEFNGIRVLFVGLVEEEWFECLPKIDKNTVNFKHSWIWARENLPDLIAQEKPNIVVAVTHQRMPQDYTLAEECGDLIDLVLGGHDHHYEHTIKNGVHILNSGTDWKYYTTLDVRMKEGKVDSVDVKERKIDYKGGEPDPEALTLLNTFNEDLEKKMVKIIGRIETPLDARFQKIRTQETNAGNLLADLVRNAMHTDLCLINSGSLRADTLFPTGPFTMGDLRKLIPMEDMATILEVTPQILLEGLEGGVSKYPALEGRFPCISGFTFSFSGEGEPNKRVIEVVIDGDLIVNNGKVLDHHKDRTFTLATTAFIGKGKDGYDAFAQAKQLIDGENSLTVPTIYRNFFTEMKVAGIFQSILFKEKKPDVDETVKYAVKCFKSKSSVSNLASLTPLPLSSSDSGGDTTSSDVDALRASSDALSASAPLLRTSCVSFSFAEPTPNLSVKDKNMRNFPLPLSIKVEGRITIL